VTRWSDLAQGQAAQVPGVPMWGRRPDLHPGQRQANPSTTWRSGLTQCKGRSAQALGVLTWVRGPG